MATTAARIGAFAADLAAVRTSPDRKRPRDVAPLSLRPREGPSSEKHALDDPHAHPHENGDATRCLGIASKPLVNTENQKGRRRDDRRSESGDNGGANLAESEARLRLEVRAGAGELAEYYAESKS